MKGGILIPEGDGPRRSAGRLDASTWSLLGWVGFVLAAMGSADLLLTWYPFDFGNTEWEFGTVTQSFNGLPTVTLGMGLWMASSIVAERAWLTRTLAIGFVVLAVLVLVGALLYATTVPMALNSVPANAIATGLKKAIAKTAAQSLAYPLVFLVVGVKGYRAAKKVG